MIFAIGFILFTFSLLAHAVLKMSGEFDVYIYRHTDWLVVLPGWGGVLLMCISLLMLIVKVMP